MDKTHFQLAWGTMMARMVLDGAVESATRFTGHFAIKLAGIPMEDADLTEGSKIETSAAASSTNADTDFLRDILGGATPAHDARLDATLAAAQALSLGGVAAVQDLEQQSTAAKPGTPPRPTLSVYAVEFEKGERICALHQAPDKRLDAFQCF